MKKDKRQPLKLLGRGMAEVMFKDMCYVPEARGRLRSQCSQHLMETVIWT